jgi:phosphoesterase RecJ-like protein
MQALADAIDKADHVLLIAHVNPDADSMGSALAMYTYLLRLQKKITLYCKTEHINPALAFLPFFDKVKHQLPSAYDLAMSFDCGSLKRLGVDSSAPLVNIDHHLSNDAYGAINLINDKAISTTQVVYEYFVEHNIKINAKMATCLYAGLIDDSQNFSTHKTNAQSFMMAADLVQCGAEHALCVQQLFKTRSLASIRMKAKMLEAAQLFCDGKVVSTLVPRSFFEQTGAYEVDCEEALHESLDLVSVEVAMMLRYTKEGKIKGSLRSKNGLDMNALASHFGGGGHLHSAGFVCEDIDLNTVEKKIISLLKETLAT